MTYKNLAGETKKMNQNQGNASTAVEGCMEYLGRAGM